MASSTACILATYSVALATSTALAVSPENSEGLQDNRVLDHMAAVQGLNKLRVHAWDGTDEGHRFRGILKIETKIDIKYY
jgi:hypothetical protein